MKISDHKIKETAYRMFTRKGIRSSSLHDIAQDCGTTVRTINHSFRNKDELVLALMEDFLDKNTGYLTLNPALSPNAVTELSNFFRSIEKLTIVLKPTVFHELRKYYAEAWHKLVVFKENNLVPYITQNIQRGLSEDCYRSNFDPETYAQVYFMTLRVLLTNENLINNQTQKIVHDMHNIFLHGILNPKGFRHELQAE